MQVTCGHRSLAFCAVPSSLPIEFHPPLLRPWDVAQVAEVVAPLPKVSFLNVRDDTCLEPAGVVVNTAKGFGCKHISLGLPTGFE
jgi:hypothetical protein